MSNDGQKTNLNSLFAPASEEQWRTLAEKALRGAPLERLVSRTADGIEIQPLTGRMEAGPRPVRHVTGAWSALARIDHPDAAAANAQALADIDGGASGLHIVCAGSATAYGFGIEPGALGDVLAGIDPASTALTLDCAPGDRETALSLVDIVEQSGLNPASARLDFGLNPLMRHLQGMEAADDLAEAVGTATELAARGFAGPILAADARPVHAAGGSEGQELGFLLAATVAYLRTFEAAGAEPALAMRLIGYRVAADQDQFLTIAKLRALRHLTARLQDACDLAPAPVHIHAETAWRMTTRTDAAVNVLRATIAAFSAAAGGADAICVLPHTQSLGLPDTAARRLARNIQLILDRESHLAQVDDPAGGSGGIEKLTDALCIKAWTLFQDIEKAGGLAHFVASGSFGSEVEAIRMQRERDTATGRAPLTGTSAYPALEDTPLEVIAPLEMHWNSGFVPAFAPFRPAAPFEALRARADTLRASGKAPRVFLANLGALAEFNARANFARNFFAAGGIASLGEEGFSDAAAVARAFSESGARIACLCSSDALYHDLGTDSARAVKAAGAEYILLAGRPGKNEAALREAGVDRFVFQGCDMIEALDAVLETL